LRFVLAAFPVPFSTSGFVLAGFDLRNSHYIQKRDVHHLKSLPITPSGARETHKETKLLSAVVDEQESFVLNPIAVKITCHNQEMIRVFSPLNS
jgi:hypothetical protein